MQLLKKVVNKKIRVYNHFNSKLLKFWLYDLLSSPSGEHTTENKKKSTL